MIGFLLLFWVAIWLVLISDLVGSAKEVGFEISGASWEGVNGLYSCIEGECRQVGLTEGHTVVSIDVVVSSGAERRWYVKDASGRKIYGARETTAGGGHASIERWKLLVGPEAGFDTHMHLHSVNVDDWCVGEGITADKAALAIWLGIQAGTQVSTLLPCVAHMQNGEGEKQPHAYAHAACDLLVYEGAWPEAYSCFDCVVNGHDCEGGSDSSDPETREGTGTVVRGMMWREWRAYLSSSSEMVEYHRTSQSLHPTQQFVFDSVATPLELSLGCFSKTLGSVPAREYCLEQARALRFVSLLLIRQVDPVGAIGILDMHAHALSGVLPVSLRGLAKSMGSSHPSQSPSPASASGAGSDPSLACVFVLTDPFLDSTDGASLKLLLSYLCWEVQHEVDSGDRHFAQLARARALLIHLSTLGAPETIARVALSLMDGILDTTPQGDGGGGDDGDDPVLLPYMLEDAVVAVWPFVADEETMDETGSYTNALYKTQVLNALGGSSSLRAAVVLAHCLHTAVGVAAQDSVVGFLVDALLQASAPVVLSEIGMAFDPTSAGALTVGKWSEAVCLQWVVLNALAPIQESCLAEGFCPLTGVDEAAGVRGLFLQAYMGLAIQARSDANVASDYTVPATFMSAVSAANPDWSGGAMKNKGRVDEGTGQVEPVKVGFLSSFFRQHSVGRLLAPIIKSLIESNPDGCMSTHTTAPGTSSAHASASVSLCITIINPHMPSHTSSSSSDSSKQHDSITSELHRLAPHWIDVDFTELSTMSRRIRRLGLDVLVFGDTVMESKTAYLTNLRMAPIQVAFWGHPYTSGAAPMDYFITSDLFEQYIDSYASSASSAWDTPITRQDHFSEQLVRFESLSFALHRGADWLQDAEVGSRDDYIAWLRSMSHDVTGRAASTVTASTNVPHPEDLRIYACLQSTMKFHPSFDRALIAVLEEDPSAIIILLRNPALQLWHDRLQTRLIRAISASPTLTVASDGARLLFASQMKPAAYRRALCGAHVSLDPFPFGGGVTMVDAVNCEPRAVPFVTYPRAQSVHPIAAGIAHKLGLTDHLVAHDVQHFAALAMAAASNHSLAREMALRKHLLSDPLEAAREWERFIKRILFII